MANESRSPYFVEVDTEGCEHCGDGTTWRVVGPDDMAQSETFDDEDEAERLADILSEAYWLGEKHGEAHR